MSNRRKSSVANAYPTELLRSPAWFARRARWFRKRSRLDGHLTCVGCELPATPDQLELHHLDYAGVEVIDGSWRAFERHDDLVPLHPYCHDLLHRLIDRDRVLTRPRARWAASTVALQRLREKLLRAEETR